MRKLLYFATALLVLAGCNNKDNALNNAPEGTPFKKGQQVTLTIGTGNNANQAPSRKVAGTDIDNQIEFAWEEGDQILVKVGDESAVFTLSSTPGSAEGEFTGTMPADGSTFDIQYPVEEPDITKQVYSTEKPIPANKMLFKATNCTLGTNATLKAQYAMVQLNLYGTDKTVGLIILSSNSVSINLTCTGGKKIGATSTEATPFYMIVPAGEYQFKVGVFDNAETHDIICLFATSEAKTFEAGKCLNMPAKEVIDPYNGHEYVDLGLHSGLKWATMNVGATKPEEYGDYFAWGETKPYYSSQTPLTWKSGKETGYAWQSYCSSTEFVEWSTTPYDAVTKILKPEYDAAAVNWGGNWRMPNDEEWAELKNPSYCTWEWISNYNSTGVAGYIVKSNTNGNSIFLPAAYYYDQCSPVTANVFGYYWSSFLDENIFGNAYHFYFDSGSKENNNSNNRCFGCSVRPVCK